MSDSIDLTKWTTYTHMLVCTSMLLHINVEKRLLSAISSIFWWQFLCPFFFLFFSFCVDFLSPLVSVMSFLSLQEFLEDLVNLQGQNLLLFWGENKEKVFDCLLTSVTWPSYFVKIYSIIIEGIPDVCVTIFLQNTWKFSGRFRFNLSQILCSFNNQVVYSRNCHSLCN